MRRFATLSFVVCVAAGLVSGAAHASTGGTRDARAEIARLVDANYPGLPHGNVACPGRVARARGSAFTCTVQVAGGFLVVEATQTDARGTVALATPQAVLAKQRLEDLVAANASLAATVDCGAGPWFVRRPGEQLVCRASLADGSGHDVQLTVRDPDGNVTITAVT